MLTIHHLGVSQSERIIWLCEELGVPYTIKHYQRDAVTRLAPPELKAVHPLGTAPVITDGDLVVPESGAIIDYIIATYGGGRLALGPSHPDFAQYLYWYHFANSNLQPVMGRNMILSRLKLAADNPVLVGTLARLERVMGIIEERVGKVPYLAGEEFTAADIMMVFSLTTMRAFFPMELGTYPNILAYLARIGARRGYRDAMHAGDPDMTPMLS